MKFGIQVVLNGKFGMINLFNNIYRDKVVLVTGHTGFKGSWLSLWLKQMGAKVVGYSLEPPTPVNHYNLLNLNIISIIGDIRDYKKLENTFAKYQPDIVFHLAAQPLVRLSYKEPKYTFETNIIGTLNIYEISREMKFVKAIVSITTDKVYENKEWIWGYKEIDPLGGYDPYSASKGCVEILTSSYRSSFFNIDLYNKTHITLLASCRAGNVIGGGDWSQDRLIPDIMKAANQNMRVTIRNPYSIRPWQHVLEPLSGYLQIGQKLLEGKKDFAQAWNFGPNNEEIVTVKNMIKKMQKYWNKIDFVIKHKKDNFYETNTLRLDCSKAYIKLNWRSIWNIDKTLENTVLWYKNFYNNDSISTLKDLYQYIERAKKYKLSWTK